MSRSTERGQSLLEFIFTIPFLLAILWGAFEFSVAFVMSQRISALSREAGNSAYRECLSRPDSELSACLSEYTAALEKQAGRLFSDFTEKGTLLTSVYAYDSVNKQVILKAQTSAGRGGHQSKFNATKINAPILQQQTWMVIGEAFYKHTPLTPLSGFFKLINIPSDIYELSVY